MTSPHDPCGTCSEFKDDLCLAHERPAAPSDPPCVLYLRRGSAEARIAARSSAEVLAELRRRESRK